MLAPMQKLKESNNGAGCTIASCKINPLEGHVTSWIFFPQTYNPSPVLRRILDKPKLRGMQQNA